MVPYNWTFKTTQHWISLAVNLSDVKISKWCSINADNDCMCLCRPSSRIIGKATLPHRQFNSWVNCCQPPSRCFACSLNGIQAFLSTTLSHPQITVVGAHMENVSETHDLYGRAAGTGLWERGCSQKNTGRTSNMDVSISQVKMTICCCMLTSLR